MRITSQAVATFLILLLSCSYLIAQDRGFRNIVKDPDTGSELRAYNESWAVIIGIDKYQHVQQLDYAVADAVAIKNLLLETFGFKQEKIFLLTDNNATRTNIIKTLGDLTQTKEEDRVLVFFAGHGETVDQPMGGQMGYLIPVDGKASSFSDLSVTSIRMSEIREISNIISAKHMLFLVDACYGGLAATGARSLTKEMKGYIRKVTAARARQILTAGGRGEQVIEKPEWGHSAFTYRLLDGLGKGLADLDENKIITGRELATYVESKVAQMTENRQRPQFRCFTEDEGEFLFILPMVATGSLSLSSQPNGTEVFLNRQLKGSTPIAIRDLTPGQYEIILKKEGYQDLTQSIKIEAGVEASITPKLIKLSKLRIESDPPGSDVFLDGNYIGKTPVPDQNVAPGMINVRVKKDGYGEWNRNFSIEPEKDLPLSIKLESDAGFLSISVSPPDVEVYIDGKKAGAGALQSLRLPTGSHEIQLKHPSYAGALSEKVSIQPSMESRVEGRFGVFTMTPALRSMLLPGLGQLMNGSTLKGVLCLAGTLGGGVYSLLSYSDYTKKTDTYTASVDAYNKAQTVADANRLRQEMQQHYVQVDDAKKKKTISLAVLAGAYVVNLLDALIFESNGGEIKILAKDGIVKIHPNLTIDDVGMRLGVQVRF
ncbi:MAG: PEGA domain-containing protein [bacterium]